MNIELKKLDNAAFFETFIKDTVEYSNPVLFNTRIEGESSSHFYINGSKKNLNISGYLNVKDLNIIYEISLLKMQTLIFPFPWHIPVPKL